MLLAYDFVQSGTKREGVERELEEWRMQERGLKQITTEDIIPDVQ